MDRAPEPIVPYELPPDHPLAREWATYCRELPRLLAEGEEGRFAVVKGEVVDSVWDTRPDAVQAGYDRFGLGPFMIHRICRVERPVIITRYFAPRLIG
jgi:hypothetical protein